MMAKIYETIKIILKVALSVMDYKIGQVLHNNNSSKDLSSLGLLSFEFLSLGLSSLGLSSLGLSRQVYFVIYVLLLLFLYTTSPITLDDATISVSLFLFPMIRGKTVTISKTNPISIFVAAGSPTSGPEYESAKHLVLEIIEGIKHNYSEDVIIKYIQSQFEFTISHPEIVYAVGVGLAQGLLDIDTLAPEWYTPPLLDYPIRRNNYYNKGLRYNIEKLMWDTPHMNFIRKHVYFLDSLMERSVLNDTLHASKKNKGNFIRLNHEKYTLPTGNWQHLFLSLLENERIEENSAITKDERHRAYHKLNQSVERVIEYLLPGEHFLPGSLKGTKKRLRKPLNQSVSDKKTSENDKPIIIEATSLNFIRNSVRLVYKENLYKVNVPKNTDITEDSNVYQIKSTKKVLAHKIISLIQQCYLQSPTKYKNSKNDRLGIVEMPFTKLASLLGRLIMKQVFLLDKKSIKNLLKATKNTTILSWIQNPSLIEAQKLFDKDIPLDCLKKWNYEPKDVKFLITYLCVKFYDDFYESDNSMVERPDIFKLLDKHMTKDIYRLKLYIERRIIKLGVVLIGLLIQEGVFTSTELLKSADLESNKQGNKNKLRKIAPYQKERVVKVSPEIANALKTKPTIERPYLIRENLNSPVAEPNFPVTDYQTFLYETYHSREENRIHDNARTECTINDPNIVNHKTRFCIDHDALMALLKVIRDFQILLDVVDMGPRRSIFSHIKVRAFLSLYNITEDQMKLLAKNIGDIKAVNIEYKLYDYLRNFDSTYFDKEIFIKYINEYDIPKKDKDFVLGLIERITGIKDSLNKLIGDAIVYSHFEHFTITSFLDTRGRRYYNNTSLNIQAYPIVKTIVKLYSTPLPKEHKPLQEEFNAISKIISTYVNSPTITDKINSSSIRERWLTKYNYDRPVTGKKLSNDAIHLRYVQLKSYFVEKAIVNGTMQLFDDFMEDLIDNYKWACLSSRESDKDYDYDRYKKYYDMLNIFYIFLKKKKQFLIALNIWRTFIVDSFLTNSTDNTVLPLRPYPYELDATASGIQMTALFLRDQQLAEWSGLCYNPHQMDLYTAAANQFKDNITAVLNYNITAITGDSLKESDLLKLNDTIQEKFHWFVKRAAQKMKTNNYIKVFQEEQQNLKNLIDKNPQLLETSYNRDLWKKSIMTYTYSSTSHGRIDDNIKYFKDEADLIADYYAMTQMATIVEDHFLLETQPTLIPSTSKIRIIAKELSSSLKSSTNIPEPISPRQALLQKYFPKVYEEDNIKKEKRLYNKKLEITITNSFLTHRIKPVVEHIEKIQSFAGKGVNRGYQVNISLDTYDAAGYRIINRPKAAQLFGPNLMHTMDAAIVHTLTTFVKGLSQALKDAGINPIHFTSIHDSFAFVDTYFAKSFIELAYLIVHQQDYINSLKDNTNFNSILAILSEEYFKEEHEKNEQAKKLKNKDYVIKPYDKKIYSVLQLNELADTFVK